MSLELPQSLLARLALLTATASLIISAGLALYRLVFSPLAKFPGSKLAAATGWYEFYFDFFCNGKYVFEIARMHKKYGPIIRINPYELSIDDAEFYSELYVTNRRRTDGYSQFIRGIDFEGSHLLTKSHDLHSRRRKPMEPFFSRLGVVKLEPMLAELVGKLENRLKALNGKQTVLRLDYVFSAFAGDVIRRVCCGSGESFLEDPEFAPYWFNLLHSVIRSIPLFTGFPQLIHVVGLIPASIMLWLEPRSQCFKEYKDMARKHIFEVKHNKNDIRTKLDGQIANVSLFHHLFNSNTPSSEMFEERLEKEAEVLLAGGTVSSARTLTFITYYILANPSIHGKLQEELKGCIANSASSYPSWAQLEKLPYLQALIKEGLRLSYGVMHRLPRCSPDIEITYKNWVIPRDIPVSMSAYILHSDPTVYPDPFEFRPERWLKATSNMTRNWVPFSRGSRNCLGMNLAQAEINYILAMLFGPNGPVMDLFETDESDVISAHDFLVTLPKLDTKGVRVVMK